MCDGWGCQKWKKKSEAARLWELKVQICSKVQINQNNCRESPNQLVHFGGKIRGTANTGGHQNSIKDGFFQRLVQLLKIPEFP